MRRRVWIPAPFLHNGVMHEGDQPPLPDLPLCTLSGLHRLHLTCEANTSLHLMLAAPPSPPHTPPPRPTCEAKASLISKTSMSSSVRPAWATASGMATAGPMPMMAGSTPTCRGVGGRR